MAFRELPRHFEWIGEFRDIGGQTDVSSSRGTQRAQESLSISCDAFPKDQKDRTCAVMPKKTPPSLPLFSVPLPDSIEKKVKKNSWRSWRLGVSTYSAGKAAQENRLPRAGKACIIWERMRNLDKFSGYPLKVVYEKVEDEIFIVTVYPLKRKIWR
jgi:hypothetical protein